MADSEEIRYEDLINPDVEKRVLAFIEKVKKELAELGANSIKGMPSQSSSSKPKLSDIEREIELTKTLENAKKGLTSVEKLQTQISQVKSEFRRKEREDLKMETSAYDKLSSELKNQQKQVKDLLASKKALSDNDKLLIKNTQALDKELKDIDAQIGLHQRNVGNYKSGWDGLGNSFNQLTREAPAFANSMQTGFMAISNNLPIFFDEIKKANDQIKELRLQGEKVPGLFSRLTSSIFSFGTLLSLGVTLLTLFGKELVSLVISLYDTEKAFQFSTDAMKEHTDQVNGLVDSYRRTRIDYLESQKTISKEQADILRSDMDKAEKLKTIDEDTNKRRVELAKKFKKEMSDVEKELPLSGEGIAGMMSTQRAQEFYTLSSSQQSKYLDGKIKENIKINETIREINESDWAQRELVEREFEMKNKINRNNSNKDKLAGQKKYGESFIKEVQKLNIEIELLLTKSEEEMTYIEFEAERVRLKNLRDSDKEILNQIIKSGKSTSDEREKAKKELLVIDEKWIQAEKDLETKANDELKKIEEKRQKEYRELRDKNYAEDLNLLESHLIELNNKKLSLRVTMGAIKEGRNIDKEIADKEIEIAQYKLDLIMKAETSSYEERERALAEFNKTKETMEKKAYEAERQRMYDNYREQLTTINNITEGLKQGLQQRADMQQQNDQKMIDYHTRMAQTQATLAAGGRDNTLAEEQAAAERAQEKKIQDAKKAAKMQQTIAIVQTFEKTLLASLDAKKPFPQAFADALLSSGLVTAAFSKMTAGFYEGTESLGESDGMRIGSGKDNILIRAHKGERILGVNDSAEIPRWMSNKDVVDASLMYANGLDYASPSLFVAPVENNHHLLKKVDTLINVIQNQPRQALSLDKLGEWTDEIEERGNKMIVNHKKNSSRKSLRING